MDNKGQIPIIKWMFFLFLFLIIGFGFLFPFQNFSVDYAVNGNYVSGMEAFVLKNWVLITLLLLGLVTIIIAYGGGASTG